MSENGIEIELSRAQVVRVLREAGRDAGLLCLAARMGELDVRAFSARLEDPRLSRSLLRGLRVLASFLADGAARPLKDVGDELGLGASTMHHYASTLLEVGLLERDPISRRYRRVVFA